MTRSLPLVAVVTLTGLTAAPGCVRMLVDKHDVSPGGQDEQRGYHARLLELTDGVTTRAAVERMLGRPDLVVDDRRVAAYRWQRVRYEKHYPDYLNRDPERGVPAAVMYSSLLLEFDASGVLRRHKKVRHRVEYGGPPALPDLLAGWRGEVAAR